MLVTVLIALILYWKKSRKPHRFFSALHVLTGTVMQKAVYN